MARSRRVSQLMFCREAPTCILAIGQRQIPKRGSYVEFKDTVNHRRDVRK